MDAIEVDGLTVSYERAGDGPAVVLLHGYVGDGPATWRPQLDGLCDEFTVIAWDAPGAGGSSDPAESFAMSGYADCLAGFIAGLGLSAPHVVGLSFGAALAIEFERRHRGVAATVTLAGGYAGWGGSLPTEAVVQRLEQARELSQLSGEEFVETLLPTMFTPGTPREVVEAFGTVMREFHPSGFRAMATAVAEDLRGALGSVAAPTLLVYGDGDVRAPPEIAEHLHGAIAGSALVYLPGVGHVCNLEAPDEFNHTVRDFLRSHTT